MKEQFPLGLNLPAEKPDKTGSSIDSREKQLQLLTQLCKGLNNQINSLQLGLEMVSEESNLTDILAKIMDSKERLNSLEEFVLSKQGVKPLPAEVEEQLVKNIQAVSLMTRGVSAETESAKREFVANGTLGKYREIWQEANYDGVAEITNDDLENKIVGKLFSVIEENLVKHNPVNSEAVSAVFLRSVYEEIGGDGEKFKDAWEKREFNSLPKIGLESNEVARVVLDKIFKELINYSALKDVYLPDLMAEKDEIISEEDFREQVICFIKQLLETISQANIYYPINERKGDYARNIIFEIKKFRDKAADDYLKQEKSFRKIAKKCKPSNDDYINGASKMKEKQQQIIFLEEIREATQSDKKLEDYWLEGEEKESVLPTIKKTSFEYVSLQKYVPIVQDIEDNQIVVIVQPLNNGLFRKDKKENNLEKAIIPQVEKSLSIIVNKLSELTRVFTTDVPAEKKEPYMKEFYHQYKYIKNLDLSDKLERNLAIELDKAENLPIKEKISQRIDKIKADSAARILHLIRVNTLKNEERDQDFRWWKEFYKQLTFSEIGIKVDQDKSIEKELVFPPKRELLTNPNVFEFIGEVAKKLSEKDLSEKEQESLMEKIDVFFAKTSKHDDSVINIFYQLNNDQTYANRYQKRNDREYDIFKAISYKSFNQSYSSLDNLSRDRDNDDYDFFLDNKNYNQLMYGLLGEILQCSGENKELKEIQEKIMSQSFGNGGRQVYALNNKFVTPEFILSLGEYFSRSFDLSDENNQYRAIPLYNIYKAKNKVLSDQQKLKYLSNFKLSDWNNILNAGGAKDGRSTMYKFNEFLAEYLSLDWNSGDFQQVDWKKYFSTPCHSIGKNHEQLSDRVMAIREFVKIARSEEKEESAEKEASLRDFITQLIVNNYNHPKLPEDNSFLYDIDLEMERLRDYNHFIKIFGLESDSEVSTAYHEQLINLMNHLYSHDVFKNSDSTAYDNYKNFVKKKRGSADELIDFDFKCLNAAVDCWHNNIIQWIDTRYNMGQWNITSADNRSSKAEKMKEVSDNMFSPILIVLKEKITDIKTGKSGTDELNTCQKKYDMILEKIKKYQQEAKHRIAEMEALSFTNGREEDNQLFFTQKFLEVMGGLMNDMEQNINYIIEIKKAVILNKETAQ